MKESFYIINSVPLSHGFLVKVIIVPLELQSSQL